MLGAAGTMEARLTGDVLLRAGVTARLAHGGRTRGEEPDGHARFVLEYKGLPVVPGRDSTATPEGSKAAPLASCCKNALLQIWT